MTQGGSRGAAPGGTPVSAVPSPPTGWARLAWLGPGFLWMVSATGSGELLFTPRIGSLYGYALLWALLAAVVLKWFINREVGRFTVCTGESIVEGLARMPGPANWALWLILIPQALVAVAVIAGLAAAGATAIVLILPGPVWIWTLTAIAASTALVLWGHYYLIERAATVLASLLTLAVLAAAASVFRSPAALTAGLLPTVPSDVDITEVLPWLGFALSGTAGMMWYSFWLKAKEYGAARAPHRVEAATATEEERVRLRGWLSQLTLDNSVAVVGTLIITLAFLVLGAELLRPRRLLPEENRIAEVLGNLLGGVWGAFGFWAMVVGVLVAFWGTVLSNQDGFARLFSAGSDVLATAHGRRGRLTDEGFLRRAYLLVLVSTLPVLLYLLVGEPVVLLATAGAIEAAQLPVLACLTLYLNRRRLPPELRPSAAALIGTLIAAGFFAAFAAAYVYELVAG